VQARIALLVVSIALTGCTSGSGTPTAPSPPQGQNPPPPAPTQPAGPPTVTVTATGVSPKEVTVAVGSHVTFVNGDTRVHDIWGGIDHEHRACPEIDVAGFLVPGQSRDTGVFASPGTCDFHDHTNLGNPAYQGRIIIR
jgi:hypothetical protein